MVNEAVRMTLAKMLMIYVTLTLGKLSRVQASRSLSLA